MHRIVIAALSFSLLISPHLSAQTVTDYATDLSLSNIGADFFNTSSRRSRITQMAFTVGPSESTSYLYFSSNEHGIRRLVYNMDNQAFVGGSLETVAADIAGLGIAFHGTTLYASEPHVSSADADVELSRIWRIEDGGFGARTAIVEGIPRQDHGVNNIQVLGGGLYVGIGVRTRNGAFQTWNGDTHGESAYGGTIGVIANLADVPSTPNAAGLFPANPTMAEYRALINGTDPRGGLPFTSRDPAKLVVHSAGTRNPFGIAFDGDGRIWFTNNFHRVENDLYDRDNLTAAEGDAFGDDGFQDDIHDQFFLATPFADYGYRNGNWQDGNVPGNTAATDSGFFQQDQRIASFTFDNYVDRVAANDVDQSNASWNQDYNPATSDGLGPSSSSNGFDFYQANTMPLKYHRDAFIARWNGRISDGDDAITYRDVVSVDIDTGEVNRIASGFRNPLDVVSDPRGNLLVADHGGSIWLLRPQSPTTDAHSFVWNAAEGNWSDRTSWNVDTVPEEDRIVPDAWRTARYAVTIATAENPTEVTLDQDARVETVSVGSPSGGDTATLRLDDSNTYSLTVTGDLRIHANGHLVGAGSVHGPVVNDGQITATLQSRFDVGDYEQTADGRLSLAGPFERPMQTDLAILAGTLELVNAAANAVGQTNLLIGTGSMEGAFDKIEGVALGDGTGIAVTYDDNRVFATRTLLGDATVNGFVDAADLNALALNWLQAGNNWTDGDFTGDRLVNAQDLNALALNWQSGVPMAVPESNLTVPIVTTALALLFFQNRKPTGRQGYVG